MNDGNMSSSVNVNTLDRKLMMGYQGWFACVRDGSDLNWWHWSTDNGTPGASNLSIDMWPDTTELSEKFPTSMNYPTGGSAMLFSSYNDSTVDQHFKWMQDYNLDGVMLQRFLSDLGQPPLKALRDRVTSNVKSSAEKYGRVFCIMYDITGSNEGTFLDFLKRDWIDLVDNGITQSPCYLRHNGKPLLAIWGLGFSDGNRPGTASEANDLITYLQSGAQPKYQVTLLGGVPTNWRTLNGDSKTDPAWAAVYTSFDVLSPWSVNRYSYDSSPMKMGADDFLNNIIQKDLVELSHQTRKIEYMPVVFPGYSTRNQGNRALNEVPRLGGHFWWRQVYNAADIAGCTMIYGAMFDEVNEGTALFKQVADMRDLPLEAQQRLVYLNLDDENLSIEFRNLTNDWYLQLASETTRRLRKGIKFTSTMPTPTQLRFLA